MWGRMIPEMGLVYRDRVKARILAQNPLLLVSIYDHRILGE